MASQNVSPYINSLVSTLGGAFTQISKGRKGDRTDEIANNLMTRRLQESGELPVPRATAVDPALEASMKELYPERGTEPVRFSGGMEGAADVIRLQDAIEQGKRRGIEDALRTKADNRSEEYLNLSKGSAERIKSQQEWERERQAKIDQAAREQRAEQARTLQSKKYQDAVKDGVSYQADIAAAMPKIQSARTRQEYEAGIAALKGIYTGAVSRGLRVDPVQVPPFRGEVIQQAQGAWGKAAGDPTKQAAIRARLSQWGIDPIKEAGLPQDSAVLEYGD
jgi:hypothetical protein